ncbi:MAG TPA: protein-export chaperone SecB [Candidatus Agathobaculum pullicola]|nr:protein-export chaperone SecB [Candidatus Agathobaculum pullicola]
MQNFNLEMYETTEFTFKNVLEVEQSVKLKTEYELELAYNEDRTRCIASFNIRVGEDKTESSNLSISLKMKGYFSCDKISSDEKPEAHIEAYNQLFPFAQSIIANFMTNSGLPPFLISKQVLDPKEIIVE